MKNLQENTTEELYDLSMLKEMDDTEYLLDMLQSLLNDSPDDFTALKTAFAKNDLTVVCQKAHKLKNSAGIIQAESLMELLQQIEAAGKNNAVTALPALINEASALYSHIETSLKNYISELS
jgi:HPt (histidine-containing phosphotransfer) domain-containing protein